MMKLLSGKFPELKIPLGSQDISRWICSTEGFVVHIPDSQALCVEAITLSGIQLTLVAQNYCHEIHDPLLFHTSLLAPLLNYTSCGSY